MGFICINPSFGRQGLGVPFYSLLLGTQKPREGTDESNVDQQGHHEVVRPWASGSLLLAFFIPLLGFLISFSLCSKRVVPQGARLSEDC